MRENEGKDKKHINSQREYFRKVNRLIRWIKKTPHDGGVLLQAGYYSPILAQVSRRPTVRLKTSLSPFAWRLSRQK